MAEIAPDIEELAKIIAFWHGQKMLYHDRDGTHTVASSRGYGRFGDSTDRYMHAHWQEYTSAAEAILNRAQTEQDSRTPPSDG